MIGKSKKARNTFYRHKCALVPSMHMHQDVITIFQLFWGIFLFALGRPVAGLLQQVLLFHQKEKKAANEADHHVMYLTPR